MKQRFHNLEGRHALTFSTEIGGLKIEVESDLVPYNEKRLHGSDTYYYTKLKEIKDELLRLSEEKKYNDNIWRNVAFKANVGQTVHLYELPSKHLVSLVSPEEWDYGTYYVGTFTLNSNAVWSKNT